MAKRTPKLRASGDQTITLVSWNAEECRGHAAKLAQAGLQVTLEYSSREGPGILRRIREAPPAAIVIDLERLPMQGRDVGVALRTARQTRHIPIVFAGGDPGKVERVRQVLPDASYASWSYVVSAIKAATRDPNPNPVVPSSNLVGYSGTELPKKLGIKPNCSIALLGEHENFVELLDDCPEGVRFTKRILPESKLALWFVRSASELSSGADAVAAALGGVAHLWICWAKRTSPLASDVNEQVVRATGLAAGLVDYKVAAIDSDWSGLLFAPRRSPQKSRS